MKWGKGTRAYRDTKSAVATDLGDETAQLLQQTAVAAYQALDRGEIVGRAIVVP